MAEQDKNLEERAADAPRVKAGMYLLYAMDKNGFERIEPKLSGDDYFFHDSAKYPQPSLKSWMPDPERNVYVWMHFYPHRDSGAYEILDKLSPDKTGEMKFLRAWNTGVSLTMDEKGDYTSIYKKK